MIPPRAAGGPVHGRARHSGALPMDSLELQDDIAARVVDLANELAEANPDADLWDIADGILSGAVHWWLYANAPCGDPMCEDCEDVQTAELRMKALHELTTEM